MKQVSKEENGKPQLLADIEEVNTAAQISTLLGIMAEKMDLKFSKQFWNDFIHKYQEIQDNAHQKRLEIQKIEDIESLVKE